MSPEIFGENVRKYRELAGLSRQQLADKMGTHYNLIGFWERGRLPSVYYLYQLANALGCGVDDLLGLNKFNAERRKIYDKALETYGKDNQIIVAIEELSELQKELTKYLRGKLDENHLIEEMADVYIMLEQLIYIFDCGTSLKVARSTKVKRLAKNLRKEGVKV